MKNPTDYEILQCIYEMYYTDYVDFVYKGRDNKRKDKIYVPISIDNIGKRMNVEGDLIFGRLYYSLNQKFNYYHDDGVRVEFFVQEHQQQGHCIQFPYLASALAELEEKRKNHRINKGLFITAIVSIFITILALIFANSGGESSCCS